MKTKLGHIANIQTGLFAKPRGKGDIIYLQARHFEESGQLAETLYPDLKGDDISQKHLLKAGDILFAAKGNKNLATVFHFRDKPAVASTTFFVIRLHEDQSNFILSEYVVWYLNHPITQTYLKGYAHGTALVSISKAILMELEIPIPAVHEQITVLRIAELMLQEKKLSQQLDKLKESKIQQQIFKSLNF